MHYVHLLVPGTSMHLRCIDRSTSGLYPVPTITLQFAKESLGRGARLKRGSGTLGFSVSRVTGIPCATEPDPICCCPILPDTRETRDISSPGHPARRNPFWPIGDRLDPDRSGQQRGF